MDHSSVISPADDFFDADLSEDSDSNDDETPPLYDFATIRALRCFHHFHSAAILPISRRP